MRHVHVQGGRSPDGDDSHACLGKYREEGGRRRRCGVGDDACNTLGVCHQLSNGFELKHGMLSGDEGVKIKSTRVSSNLNLDNTPLLTMCTLVKIMQE